MKNYSSPWSAYGRLPVKPEPQPTRPERDVTFGAMDSVARDREQLQKYLRKVMSEYNEIRSGQTGYRKLLDDAMQPSRAPESIEERFARLAREAAARRSPRSPRPPQL